MNFSTKNIYLCTSSNVTSSYTLKSTCFSLALDRRLPKRNNLLRLIGLTLSMWKSSSFISCQRNSSKKKMSELSAKNEVSSSSKIHKPTDGGQTTLSQDEDTTSTTSDVSNDLVISFQNMHTL